MKILLVTEFFPADLQLQFTGGVEARTFFIARHLAESHQVKVICRKTKSLKKFKKIKNIQIFPTGLSTAKTEASFFSLGERLIFMIAAFFQALKQDFDLVEGSNFVSFLPAFLAGCCRRKPVLAWYADVLKGKWFKLFGLTGLFGGVIERVSLKLPWTKVIALSRATKNKLVEAGLDKEKISLVYGGVEVRKLTSLRIKKDKNKKNIICISRLVRYKRVGDLIKAFAGLFKDYQGLTLTIVGRGPEEKKLHKLVKEKKLGKKAVFLKDLGRKRLLKLLKASYLFCLPSVVEGFGLATLEAAACQTPYIITDIKVNKEVTGNGQGGLLFKKKDVKDLQKKIKQLLEDKNLYQQKQQEGLKLAEKYDWKKIAGQTNKIYQQVLN